MDQQPYDDAFMDVTRLGGVESVTSAAAVVSNLATLTLDADLASVSRRDTDGHVTLLAGDETLADLYRLRSSPLPWDQDGDGLVTTVPDTRSDRRFPEFSHRAHALGVRSFRIARLPPIGGQRVNVDLFARTPDVFGDWTARDSQVLRCAGLVLATADQIANLTEAMDTRGVIGQAQGILMERYALSANQAMDYLKRLSQASQTRVRDIARKLCATYADDPQVPDPQVPDPQVPDPQVPDPQVPDPQVADPQVAEHTTIDHPTDVGTPTESWSLDDP